MGGKRARKRAAEKAKATPKQDTENVPCGVRLHGSLKAWMEYVGTLRWSPDTHLPPLPSAPHCGPLEGWSDFLSERLRGTPHVQGNTLHIPCVAMLDGLSFPLTFLWALRQMVHNKALSVREALHAPTLRIIAAGCSHRLEQHILQHSNYFEEWPKMLPRTHIDCCMVGPEMQALSNASRLADDHWTQVTERFRYKTSQDTLGEALQAAHDGKGATVTTIVIVYNSGMASGDTRLQESWRRDVECLLDTNVVAIFTCANEYLDLRNESVRMRALGARFVLDPQENPFAAATTLHPPGKREEYTRANAFVYAVRGRRADGG